jgi:hypothetical protein
MNKKAITIITVCFSAVLVILALNVTATPDETQDHDICHTVPGGYTIGHTLNATNFFDPSVNVTFNVTATGTNLFVQAPLTAKDNNEFNILPITTRITDGSPNDQNPNPNEITVVFNITTPVKVEFYYILIIAGDDSVPGGSPPPFAFVEIKFSIGGAAPPPFEFDFSKLLDHYEIYLGIPALILVTLGTVLVLVNENKFVKVHGILAGSSWILTVVNFFSAIIQIPITDWINNFPKVFYHIPHMILGSLGLISGFLSMLFGIAAERKPALITGYITLVSWWAAFLFGFFINPNLFVLF